MLLDGRAGIATCARSRPPREESQRRSPRRGAAVSGAGAGRLALVLAGRLLHGGLHLLEGAYLDLADPLARDAELGGEVLEGRWFLGEPPRLENALLALVQGGQRARQVALAPVELLRFAEPLLLAWRLIDQPVLPLAGFRIGRTHRRVERGVTAQPAVHGDDIVLGHAELGGDLLDL